MKNLLLPLLFIFIASLEAKKVAVSTATGEEVAIKKKKKKAASIYTIKNFCISSLVLVMAFVVLVTIKAAWRLLNTPLYDKEQRARGVRWRLKGRLG